MHGQFHFCRREPSFYPAPPFPPASPPPAPPPPALHASHPSRSLSATRYLSLCLPASLSRSLRGNFFDKLFSAFFASGCKLNPPWRLEEACISPGCPQDPGCRHLPPFPRLALPSPFPPPSLPSLPLGPPAITADTKPIRAGYRLHYHFTFFVRSPKTREEERGRERESPGNERLVSRRMTRSLARQILRALSAGEGG